MTPIPVICADCEHPVAPLYDLEKDAYYCPSCWLWLDPDAVEDGWEGITMDADYC